MSNFMDYLNNKQKEINKPIEKKKIVEQKVIKKEVIQETIKVKKDPILEHCNALLDGIKGMTPRQMIKKNDLDHINALLR